MLSAINNIMPGRTNMQVSASDSQGGGVCRVQVNYDMGRRAHSTTVEQNGEELGLGRAMFGCF